MKAHGYAAIPLINHKTGEYISSISEGDLLWYIVDNERFDLFHSEDISINKLVIKKKIEAMSVDADFEEIINRVSTQNFVPIIDDIGILMGIVTRRSVLNYLKTII